jgi:AcrR family transcriptional regulator
MNQAVPDPFEEAGADGGSTTGSGGDPATGGPDRGSTSADAGAGDGSSTRRRILQIALTLMSQRGVDGTSMRDLASAAGLNVASLYHYFPSKRDLLESVLVEHGFLPLAVTAPSRPDRPEPEGAPATESDGESESDSRSESESESGSGTGSESDLAGLIEGILDAMFKVEDFVRLMVGEAMRGEETARTVGLDLFSNFERSIEAWVRTHRPDLDERAGAGEVSRLISAMVIGLFIQHAASALPDEGDDLAALFAKRAAEAARVISP